MPLARLVLILVLVIVAAGLTVWLGALVASAVQYPMSGMLAAIPFALAAYVILRIVRDRARSAEDSHYDRIEK